MGICGGFQMLGQTLSDPEHAEDGGTLRGMGLLETETVFRSQKQRSQTAGVISGVSGMLESLSGCPVTGYEIHMGETVCTGNGVPFCAFAGRQSRRLCQCGRDSLRHIPPRHF